MGAVKQQLIGTEAEAALDELAPRTLSPAERDYLQSLDGLKDAQSCNFPPEYEADISALNWWNNGTEAAPF